MNNFFSTVSQFTNLSVESKQELSSCLKKLEFPKGHILVKQDTVCNFVYFIDNGLTRTYYLKDGKEQLLYLRIYLAGFIFYSSNHFTNSLRGLC
jgi:CRP-like cAMP-binding protein